MLMSPIELVGAEVKPLLKVDMNNDGWLDDHSSSFVTSDCIGSIETWNLVSCN